MARLHESRSLENWQTRRSSGISEFRLETAMGSTWNRRTANERFPGFPDAILSGIMISFLLVVSIFFPVHQPTVKENDPAYSNPFLKEQVPVWAIFVLVVLSWALTAGLTIVVWKDRMDLIRSSLSWALMTGLTLLLTHLLKISAGKPRPNYFHNENQVDRGLSFPSGHSSVSMACCHFLYLWSQWRIRESKAFREFRFTTAMVCALPHLLAGWIAITRVQDFWHDYIDITAGAILGVASARFTFFKHYSMTDRVKAHALEVESLRSNDDEDDGDDVLHVES